ncbi:hypothetical protein A4H97_19755 [Niastella yeongjuensis]|uniref:Secretion system C-terminal sorting domain-containing protein n=1 Tax=Niastella yeongjuensis TaxID=354355 RepID=A0A1V9FCD4_9BACT|nr:T9SS type A sorting domain-containing protein [Niastella yeongjuensis]OQP55836.1 hypothetical protein A4H97_19755 [Niastella yeongjuensis]SEP47384.1 Por secretion system C-terminal sorting domain-containing protein [Niastella yeongjuensis]
MRKPFLLTFLLLSITYLIQAQFTAGNLAVFRADVKANNTTVTIIELNRVTAGQSLPVSSYGILGTGPNALRISGSAGTTGYMANSNDGTLLCFTGHNFTNTADNANSILERGVGTLNAAGTFRLAATYKGTDGQQTRCATTLDNYNMFIADQAGVYTNDVNATPSPAGNFKSVKAFGGTVYIFQSSTAVPVVGTLSAASGGTVTALPGLANGPDKSVDFYMVSSGSNGSAFDVLYILQGNSATLGAISKYSLVTGSWVSNGTYTTSFGGLGLAAEKSGSGFNLYATSGDGTVAANNVVRLTDDAGYNTTINITTANNSVLYTSPAGTIMKGIAFAPVASTSPSVIPSPVSKNFGNIFSGSVSAAQTVTLTGENLSPAAGSLTVTAPGADFEVSSDGLSWGASTTVAYTGGGASIGSFLIRFAPTSSGAKSGIVTVTGGSLAAAVNVAVSGLGDNSLSLAFSASTTPFLNPPAVSGTINDAGDPPKQTGIIVTVQENGIDIPAANYTLTASSSNQGVVPDANVAITTADGQATVKIDPLVVGYSDITLTLTRGGDSKTLVIKYAASLNPQVTPVSYWPTGIADASAAIALDDDYMIVANDETNLLYVFDRKNSGLPVKTYDFSSLLALSGSSEVDLEAGVRSIIDPAKIYWMGSMSNSSNSPWDFKQNRNRVFTVTVNGTGAATSFTFDKYVNNLREELVAWGDNNGYDFTNATKDGTDPKASTGFNIEGMVFGPDNTTLYIGFRAPLVPMGSSTKALIAPVQDFENWYNNGGVISIGAPIELDLGGRGIRDMIRLSNGNYVIIAGSYDETAMGAIYTWTGYPGQAPKQITVMDITALNVEGVLPINIGGVLMDDRLQVISDNGDNVFYGDAIAAKDLATDNFRKFSSNILLAPSDVLPVIFEYFTASKQSKSVVLNWKSAQLEGVERFEILRSTNGTDFTSIGFVPAAMVQTTYSYTDNNVTTSGKAYYSIRSIEHGGITAVTPIRYVDFDSQLPLITLYPNPVVNNRFSILADKPGTKTVTVYSSNGTLFRQLIINGQVTDISTIGWPKGWYLINIKTVDGASVSYKVIVP